MEGLGKEKGESVIIIIFSWGCDHKTHIGKEEKAKSKKQTKKKEVSRVYQRSLSFLSFSTFFSNSLSHTGEEKKVKNTMRGLNGEREGENQGEADTDCRTRDGGGC